MADITPAPDSPTATESAPPRRDVKRMLLTVLRLGILTLTVVLVIVAIPFFYNHQHIVPVAGVSARPNKIGETVITYVMSGTPAAQAGILVSDVLIAVNGKDVPNGATPLQLYDLTSGWVNTPLTVTVHTGAAPPRTVSILRAPDPNSVAARLSELGISIEFIIDYMIFMDIGVLAVYLMVALVLIMRAHTTPFLYFASIALATFGASATNSMQWLARDPSVWGALASIYIATGFAAAFTFMGFLYPDGRWVPRRGRILVGIVRIRFHITDEIGSLTAVAVFDGKSGPVQRQADASPRPRNASRSNGLYWRWHRPSQDTQSHKSPTSSSTTSASCSRTRRRLWC